MEIKRLVVNKQALQKGLRSSQPSGFCRLSEEVVQKQNNDVHQCYGILFKWEYFPAENKNKILSSSNLA